MSERPIILFDGVCNLCHRGVRFILKRDRAARFDFAALQSSVGRALVARCGLDPEAVETMVLIEDGQRWVRSDAVLRVARHLGAPWRWTACLLVLPAGLRDVPYRMIAAGRFRLFGRRAACDLPSPADRSRFLDAEELSG